MSTGKKQRPAYHHGQLREALIEATARLAGKEGLDAVTMRRVASLVGVSQTAAYHHFAGKAALLEAVAEEAFRRMEQAMMAAEKRHNQASPAERLQALGCEYVRFAVRNPNFFRVMFSPALTGPNLPAPDSHRMHSFQRLIEAMQAVAGEEGEPSPAVMDNVLFAWSTVHGLSALWLEGSLSQHPAYAPRGIEALAEAITGEAGALMQAKLHGAVGKKGAKGLPRNPSGGRVKSR